MDVFVRNFPIKKIAIFLSAMVVLLSIVLTSFFDQGLSASNNKSELRNNDLKYCKSLVAGHRCSLNAKKELSIPEHALAAYKLPNLKPGVYDINIRYNSSGKAKKDYKHKGVFRLNSKKISDLRLDYSRNTKVVHIKNLRIGKNSSNFEIITRNNINERNSEARLNIQRITFVRDQQADSRAFWAYMVNYQVQAGRISLSKDARKDLSDAMRNNCSVVEGTGQCAKIHPKVLEALYKFSKQRKIGVWHFLQGPHVANSNHYEGKGIDLINYDRSHPLKKGDVLKFFKKNGFNELIGPGCNAAHSGPVNGHWHVALQDSYYYC
jgi:hypothetical protein